MKLDKRTTTVLGIAVIAILLMLSGFFIVNPSITAQKEMSDELETAKQQSADYQAQIVELETVKENIGTYEAQDEELTTKFPSQADIELLLNDITKAGNDSGVNEITTIQTGVPEVVIAEPGAEAAPAEGEAADPAEEAPAEEAPAEGEVAADPAAAAEPQGSDLAIMSLNLTAEGSEDSLRDYATALTEMPRSFLIESISITCDGGCTLTASGTTYLYRPTVSPEEEQPEGEAVQEAPVEEAPITEG